ncbi:hypothetical protein [Kitasatospora sp. NPDC018619]|uniref:hypothetical protein n=1 Tax=unclassified Kitasatospora TaxID=2633591 RepID=UPI0037B83B04
MAEVRVLVAAGIALALAGVAGCSDGGSAEQSRPAATTAAPSSLPPAPVPTPTPTPTPTPDRPSGDPAVVLGSVLKTYLPTAETVPSGWVLNTKFGSAHESDSGAQVLTGATTLGPTAPCDTMSNMTVLDGYAAYASQQLESSDGRYPALVTMASFRAGEATKQLATIRDFVARCPSFVAKGMGTGGSNPEVRLAAEPVDGLGDEALDVRISPQGAYRSNETVLVRIGDRVVNLRCTSDQSGRLPDLAALARELAKPVR